MSFAVAFVILVLGVGNYTVAGHAWISHRVVYRWRARAIGIFEISWALAMLVGAPVVAVLINQFGWRGPFVALAAGSLIGAFVVALVLPTSAPRSTVTPTPTGTGADDHPDGALSDLRRRPAMTHRAWLVVTGSALLALAGISVFVISGSWLSDSFDVSTSGIGVVAMGFGAVELTASTSIVAFADRLGKMRSTLAGICTVLVGIGIMSIAGDRLAIGVVGLLVFLLGFEYGFVTWLSLTSEAMPESRGATLAIGNAVGTLARGSGIILSGVLYGAFGIAGSVTLSACAATGSFTCYRSVGASPLRRTERSAVRVAIADEAGPDEIGERRRHRIGVRVRTEMARVGDLGEPATGQHRRERLECTPVVVVRAFTTQRQHGLCDPVTVPRGVGAEVGQLCHHRRALGPPCGAGRRWEPLPLVVADQPTHERFRGIGRIGCAEGGRPGGLLGPPGQPRHRGLVDGDALDEFGPPLGETEGDVAPETVTEREAHAFAPGRVLRRARRDPRCARRS